MRQMQHTDASLYCICESVANGEKQNEERYGQYYCFELYRCRMKGICAKNAKVRLHCSHWALDKDGHAVIATLGINTHLLESTPIICALKPKHKRD